MDDLDIYYFYAYPFNSTNFFSGDFYPKVTGKSSQILRLDVGCISVSLYEKDQHGKRMG